MSETPSQSMSPSTRNAVIGLTVGLLLGLLLTGYVWSSQRGVIRANEQTCTEQLDAAAATRGELEASVATLEGQVASATATRRLLEARIVLAHALKQLDERNFGTANEQVADAAALLAKVDAAAAGVDAAKLKAVQEALAGTNLVVATDMAGQVALIGRLAAELDKLSAR